MSMKNPLTPHAINWVLVNQNGIKLNGTHLLLVYADDVNM